ncbi:MAG: GYD domain-containing protein [Anaerolineae bacterium]|nr:GYD domain-containing protein [Anaerolineae bacterium]
MPTYITLLKWTEKGIGSVKESPDRLDAAKEAYKAVGAELKEFYLVMGQYDGVFVIEAPDDETVAKLALTFGPAGVTVRTETMRAFTEEEYRRIIAALP